MLNLALWAHRASTDPDRYKDTQGRTVDLGLCFDPAHGYVTVNGSTCTSNCYDATQTYYVPTNPGCGPKAHFVVVAAAGTRSCINDAQCASGTCQSDGTCADAGWDSVYLRGNLDVACPLIGSYGATSMDTSCTAYLHDRLDGDDGAAETPYTVHYDAGATAYYIDGVDVSLAHFYRIRLCNSGGDCNVPPTGHETACVITASAGYGQPDVLNQVTAPHCNTSTSSPSCDSGTNIGRSCSSDADCSDHCLFVAPRLISTQAVLYGSGPRWPPFKGASRPNDTTGNDQPALYGVGFRDPGPSSCSADSDCASNCCSTNGHTCGAASGSCAGISIAALAPEGPGFAGINGMAAFSGVTPAFPVSNFLRPGAYDSSTQVHFTSVSGKATCGEMSDGCFANIGEGTKPCSYYCNQGPGMHVHVVAQWRYSGAAGMPYYVFSNMSHQYDPSPIDPVLACSLGSNAACTASLPLCIADPFGNPVCVNPLHTGVAFNRLDGGAPCLSYCDPNSLDSTNSVPVGTNGLCQQPNSSAGIGNPCKPNYRCGYIYNVTTVNGLPVARYISNHGSCAADAQCASGCCSVDGSSCGSTKGTCTATTCIPDHKSVFVTAASYTGNLGGLAGANQICSMEASQAGLSGTYTAWLASSTTSAVSNAAPTAELQPVPCSGDAGCLSGCCSSDQGSTCGSAHGSCTCTTDSMCGSGCCSSDGVTCGSANGSCTFSYRMVDGSLTPVARSWTGFASADHAHAVDVAPNGAPSSSSIAWTGAGADGAYHDPTCRDWTVGGEGSGTRGNHFGTLGSTTSASNGSWSENGRRLNCNSDDAYLYCLQQ
jgi:hypothetical protein